MRAFSAKFALTLLVAARQGLASVTQGISGDIYNRLDEMATISMAAYADLCNIPATLTTVGKIYNAQTDINGWVLRDDSRQEIVTVFRGTGSDTNLALDTNYTQAPFDTLSSCKGCAVHGGYYIGWTSVQNQVESLVQQQTSQYPEYTLTVTGHRYESCTFCILTHTLPYFHVLFSSSLSVALLSLSCLTQLPSLGASMATITAAQLSAQYSNISLYTFGEPRSGNQAFATYVNGVFNAESPETTQYFRTTHANDGIPNLPSTDLGYVHGGVEYWTVDPNSPQNTSICTGEAIQCCEAQGGEGVNAAHVTYFGMTSGACTW